MPALNFLSDKAFLDNLTSVAGLIATVSGVLQSSKAIPEQYGSLILAICTGIIGWSTQRKTTIQ